VSARAPLSPRCAPGTPSVHLDQLAVVKDDFSACLSSLLLPLVLSGVFFGLLIIDFQGCFVTTICHVLFPPLAGDKGMDLHPHHSVVDGYDKSKADPTKDRQLTSWSPTTSLFVLPSKSIAENITVGASNSNVKQEGTLRYQHSLQLWASGSDADWCPSCADDVFGPVVAEPCRRHFTSIFMYEQSILSIGPSSLMLLVPSGLCWLCGADVKIRSRFQH
jgi:hypothetical protein